MGQLRRGVQSGGGTRGAWCKRGAGCASRSSRSRGAGSGKWGCGSHWTVRRRVGGGVSQCRVRPLNRRGWTWTWTEAAGVIARQGVREGRGSGRRTASRRCLNWVCRARGWSCMALCGPVGQRRERLRQRIAVEPEEGFLGGGVDVARLVEDDLPVADGHCCGCDEPLPVRIWVPGDGVETRTPGFVIRACRSSPGDCGRGHRLAPGLG